MEETLRELRGKRVLFVGQTRTMSEEDIALFLDRIGAERAQNMEEEGIGMVVLGRLVNPLEEAFADEREKDGIPVVSLEMVERHYARTIEPATLLGSLALFANRERIVNLLHNPAIDDELFCDILALYDWQDVGVFESDENRDVAGTIVKRFYPEIDKNHNIQYSPVGPFLVAAQSDVAPLLEAMAGMPDYAITQRSQDPWMPRTLHEALLGNPHLPLRTLEKFLKSDDLRLEGLAAAHPALPRAEQKRLVERQECWIHEGLARNPNLDPALHMRLLKSDNPQVRRTFLRAQRLDDETIERILAEGSPEDRRALGANIHLDEEQVARLLEHGDETVAEALAANPSLSPHHYEMLAGEGDTALLRVLAGNPAVPSALLERLTRVRDKALYRRLAANPSMPSSRLRQFAKIKDREIQAALAANPSTPIEILLGFQTDGELNQILKRNEAFGDYIRQNLGMA